MFVSALEYSVNKQVFIISLFGLEKHLLTEQRQHYVVNRSNLIHLKNCSIYFMLIIQANKNQRGRGTGHVIGQWKFDLKSIM